MFELMMLGLAGTGAVAAFAKTRSFVRERLRFVDAIHRRWAPWLAGAATALAAVPLVWLLPVLGGGTAALLGVAVGYGVVRGRRDVLRLPSGRAGPAG